MVRYFRTKEQLLNTTTLHMTWKLKMLVVKGDVNVITAQETVKSTRDLQRIWFACGKDQLVRRSQIKSSLVKFVFRNSFAVKLQV